MPIAKGSEYGAPGPVPDGLVVVRSDAEARSVLERARRERRPYPPLGLLGGDLCRTLGGGAGRDSAGRDSAGRDSAGRGGAGRGGAGRDNAGRGGAGRDSAGRGGAGRERELAGVHFPVDLGVVLADGRIHLFVATLVARSRLWTRAFVAMNAQWLGSRNLGPRAHPGDGLLDTYDARLPLRQVLAVAGRARLGAHLPHPGIRERRVSALQVDLEEPLRLRLDGVAVGKARTLALRVEPDALLVVV